MGLSHKYISTFCFHEDHKNCRLTCKTCKNYCLCQCHRVYVPIDVDAAKHAAREALIIAAHDYDGMERWRKIKLREALEAGVPLNEVADIVKVSRQTAARWCQ